MAPNCPGPTLGHPETPPALFTLVLLQGAPDPLGPRAHLVQSSSLTGARFRIQCLARSPHPWLLQSSPTSPHPRLFWSPPTSPCPSCSGAPQHPLIPAAPELPNIPLSRLFQSSPTFRVPTAPEPRNIPASWCSGAPQHPRVPAVPELHNIPASRLFQSSPTSPHLGSRDR